MIQRCFDKNCWWAQSCENVLGRYAGRSGKGKGGVALAKVCRSGGLLGFLRIWGKKVHRRLIAPQSGPSMVLFVGLLCVRCSFDGLPLRAGFPEGRGRKDTARL